MHGATRDHHRTEVSTKQGREPRKAFAPAKKSQSGRKHQGAPSVSLNRVYQGDCLSVLQRLAGQGLQVQLVFADPPYNIGYQYDLYDDRRDKQEYLQWTRQWVEAVLRVLSPQGTFWMAMCDEHVAEVKQICEAAGLHLRNWVVWYYTFGVHCRKKFTRSHTHLLYFVRDPSRFTFNDRPIRVPSARQLVYADTRANHGGRVPDNTWILRPPDGPPGTFAAEQDVWYFSRVAGTFKERAGFHSCQMPERLLERIILACSHPQDVVLDPFAGSGSTLVVAKKLGRRFVGCELSLQYVQQIRARLQQTRCGDPVEGPQDPLATTPPSFVYYQKRLQLDREELRRAFRAVHEGYSLDRVLADPVLSARLSEECSRRGLPGTLSDWLRELLAMRKSRQLGVPGSRRTHLPARKLDPVQDAAEVALARMRAQGWPSLDAVLCDPLGCWWFDRLARSLAPGGTSLEYRWAAIQLRKRAHKRRKRLQKVRLRLGKCRPLPLEADSLGEVPRGPAVYALQDGSGKRTFYVGETLNGQARLERVARTLDAWQVFVPSTKRWRVELVEVDAAQAPVVQLQWVLRRKPPLNFYDEKALRVG